MPPDYSSAGRYDREMIILVDPAPLIFDFCGYGGLAGDGDGG
jgi:hypothetical protein